MAKELPEYQNIQFDSKEIIRGLMTFNETSISFEEDLVKNLKDEKVYAKLLVTEVLKIFKNLRGNSLMIYFKPSSIIHVRIMHLP